VTKPSSLLWRFVRRVALALLVVVLLLAVVGWYKLFRTERQEFASVEEQFKYGSIGTESAEGIPYWIWVVLPRVFPEHLPGPGGYASLGFVWEQGHETPVGFSKKTIGFARIGINCALCHSGSYRTDAGQYTTAVPAAPATTVDVLAYERFLFACASDPKFKSDVLMPAIDYNTKLSPVDRILYSNVLIPATKKALLKAKDRFAWTEKRPAWGRGRIDPFNPVKFTQLEQPIDDTIGNSDMEPIWNLSERTGHFHWDGLQDNLREVFVSSAFGDGTPTKDLPFADLQKLQDWLMHVQPPAYPYPIDAAAARAGADIFQQKCMDCHAGARTGKVIPIAELGTDVHRIDMWTDSAANKYNTIKIKGDCTFSHFQHKTETNGYVATPLSGAWLRAPYLHNGSVPTLEDLLKPAAERPKGFYRGYDLYDRKQVGFVHDGPDAQRSGQRFDVSLQGNGNVGHEGEPFGTTLNPQQKKQLVEYLKTL
jgi:mono/diheme cytochrome c family protein